MSVQVSYKKQFALGIMLLIILLAIIEIFSIIILDQRDSCNDGLWKSKLFSEYSHDFVKSLCSDYKSIIDYETPYKHWEPNQVNNSVTINSLGIRGSEINTEKDPDTYRIIMLGGSAMYGLYATTDSSTIPGFLENKIENENPTFGVEIINAGVNGASSFDEINLLKDKLLSLAPDMIIVYDGGNDLLKKIQDENNTNNSWPGPIEKFSKQIRNYYKTTQLIDFIDRVFQKQISNDNSKLDQISDENIQKKVIKWKERWKTVCESEEMNEIQTVISIQPYLGTGNKNFSEWENMTKQNTKNIDVSSSYHLILEQLDELKTSCSMTLNLTNVFDNYSETIFYDLIHVGELGNELVAERLYDEILPILKTHFN
tara:strand:+ start:3561 stop:4673 length:1113 start_codon:yes stop_codon:yes gene_type:complete